MGGRSKPTQRERVATRSMTLQQNKARLETILKTNRPRLNTKATVQEKQSKALAKNIQQGINNFTRAKQMSVNNFTNKNVNNFMQKEGRLQDSIFQPAKGSKIQVKLGNNYYRVFTKVGNFSKTDIRGGQAWAILQNNGGKIPFDFMNGRRTIRGINHISLVPLNRSINNWQWGNIHFTKITPRDGQKDKHTHYGRTKNRTFPSREIHNVEKWNRIVSDFKSGLKPFAKGKMWKNKKESIRAKTDKLKKDKLAVNAALATTRQELTQIDEEIEKLQKRIKNSNQSKTQTQTKKQKEKANQNKQSQQEAQSKRDSAMGKAAHAASQKGKGKKKK